MKKTIVIALALALGVSAFAQEGSKTSHFKFYGFIRNYFAYDTRESNAGTEDLYFYMPKDVMVSDGVDMNATPSFRFASLTTRAGVDVSGYEVAGYRIGAKIEADFYAGLTGSTGTAQFRLRQAYLTLDKGVRSWKLGQAWHPMSVDLPDVFSLESGAPFGPFSRTPQVTFDLGLGEGWGFTLSALWQMQYTSTGPEGASANYIKYSCVPEFYFGVNKKWDNGVFKIGADYLNIKPTRTNYLGKLTNSREVSMMFYEYGQVNAGGLTIREKVTYANDGSHMNMVGGYGVSDIASNGEMSYCPTRNLSGWLSLQYKAKNSNWVPEIFFGVTKNFGTRDAIVNELCWFKNSATTINQLFRIQPEILYNLGKVQFGLEYMATCARYGKAGDHMVATADLHNVTNHRIQALVKYTF